MGRRLNETFLEVFSAVWLSYEDANGVGYAQPDFFILFEKVVVVFEAKLTQCDSGYSQLRLLYGPLLRLLFKRPALGVLVCKNLISSPALPLLDPLDLPDKGSDEIFTWHLVR